MSKNNLNIRIRELEVSLANEQEKYISSVRSHGKDAGIKAIRYDILARKFELEALYAQLK
jgi:hypothetical protein